MQSLLSRPKLMLVPCDSSVRDETTKSFENTNHNLLIVIKFFVKPKCYALYTLGTSICCRKFLLKKNEKTQKQLPLQLKPKPSRQNNILYKYVRCTCMQSSTELDKKMVEKKNISSKNKTATIIKSCSLVVGEVERTLCTCYVYVPQKCYI